MKRVDQNNVAERWKTSYYRPALGKWLYPDRESIYNEIIAANGDAGKIKAVIGNDTWTNSLCDECGERKNPVIELIDCGDSQIYICLDCLKKAVQLAESRSK